jgi:hypothetical protein
MCLRFQFYIQERVWVLHFFKESNLLYHNVYALNVDAGSEGGQQIVMLLYLPIECYSIKFDAGSEGI